MKYARIPVTILFAATFAMFLSAPQIYMQSFLDGVTVWALNVLPSLFPFAVLAPLATKFFPRGKRSLTKFLFGTDADDVFLISLLCGYPMGAKAIAESRFTKQTSTTLCSFCSTASPVFVIATVGAKLLKNATATWILALSLWFSAIANGLLHRNASQEKSRLMRTLGAGDLSDAITSAILSVLSVGGLVALFYMLTDIAKAFLPSNLANSPAISFAFGLLEMTNGIVSICATSNTMAATVASSALLSFGGACVFLQSLALLGGNVRPLKFLQMKATQAGISALVSFVLCKIFM